ncbi:MAG: GNAT family N-acetyltransferase [Syntrophobacteraceae bacterium]
MILKTISDLPQLQTLRVFWENWQRHPNSDFALFRLVCDLRSEVLRPHVISAERQGHSCALLMCRLERTHIVPRIGYFSRLRVPAVVLAVIHKGLIGKADRETAHLMVRELWELLSKGAADAVSFHHLSEDSPLLEALLADAPRWWCQKKPVWSVHRAMVLMDEPGFLLKNLRSKHRTWIRRKQRDLDADFPGKVSWTWIKHFDDIPGLCARIDRFVTRTYQRGLGAGFVDDEDHRRRFALFADRGQLRVLVLEIGGDIKAFWIGILYCEIFHLWTTGYDPDLRDYELGTLSFVRMTDELVNEGVRKIDFGLGDAHYKQRFAHESWRETTVTMFAPTLKGFLLRSLLGMSVFLDRAGRRLLEKMGFLDRLKTALRRRMLSTGTGTGEK